MVKALCGLALVALAVGLSVCGAATAIAPIVPTASAAVSGAAAASSSAGGMRFDMAVTVSATGQEAVTVRASGMSDDDGADMRVDLSGVAPGGVHVGGATVNVRVLKEDGDEVMYIGLPSLMSVLPGGKSWIRADLQDAGKAMGPNLNSTVTQNPSDELALLRSVGDVKVVGTESIDGVEATHYTGAIDLAELASTSGIPSGLVDRLGSVGVSTSIPFEAWIGDDGLVRRVLLNYSFDTSGQQGSIAAELNYSDYGMPLDVSAPPSSEVLDFNSLPGLDSLLGIGG